MYVRIRYSKHFYYIQASYQKTDIDEWNKDVQIQHEGDNAVETEEEGDAVPSQEMYMVQEQRVSRRDALRSLNNVLQWVEENENEIDYSSVVVLHNLRNKLVQLGVATKQPQITSFLRKV